MRNFTKDFLRDISNIVSKIDTNIIEEIVKMLVDLRDNKGRLFILGVGGGAGHASHAVNDFRKITEIEAYTPTDNVSELTARINDDGWDTSFLNWLKVSNLRSEDVILVFSVGGGNLKKKISINLVNALKYAKGLGVKICGVVGRKDGYTAIVADLCLIVPDVNSRNITAYTETIQSLVWHILVTHPRLQKIEMKWESITQNEK